MAVPPKADLESAAFGDELTGALDGDLRVAEQHFSVLAKRPAPLDCRMKNLRHLLAGRLRDGEIQHLGAHAHTVELGGTPRQDDP